jgi:Carboxypeptidase regulatory-like domain
MCMLRITGPLTLTALLTAMLSLPTHAQTLQSPSGPSSTPTATPEQATNKLPEAPEQHTQFAGNIVGTVLDSNGAEIPGATITLENINSRVERTLTSDDSGFFQFQAVEPGTFSLTVTSTGFAPWTSASLPLHPGQSYDLPPVELKLASDTTSIAVTVTRHDIAEDEIHYAEKQRVLGVFPNFYASYIWNAAPLSTGQKFRLALKTTVDPISLAIPAVIAGVEQSQNSFSGYGQGVQGFSKRFGATSADSAISIMITDAILPTVLHQDPRYFYKGKGSVRSRAMYAVSTVFICKGDNGRWQPNYSNVLGNLATAGLSNAYYPSTDRGIHLTVDNWLVGTASGAVGALFQEFLVKRISHGVHAEPGL